MPLSVAALDHEVAEARLAELTAWNAGNSRAAEKYRLVWDNLLLLRPILVMDERITSGVVPQLG